MRVLRTILTIAALLSLPASAARAQDEGKVGITMGYPSAVGVLWRATDRVAFRPEFTVSTGSSDSTSSDTLTGSRSGTSPSDNWQTGAGLSVLFFVTHHDGLRTYVSPRFSYSRVNSSLSVAGSAASTASDAWSYATSGSFGAQYALGRHFGVFGEIGLAYTSTTSRLTTIESVTIGSGGGGTITTNFTVRSDAHSHSLGTRSGAGVIVFF